MDEIKRIPGTVSYNGVSNFIWVAGFGFKDGDAIVLVPGSNCLSIYKSGVYDKLLTALKKDAESNPDLGKRQKSARIRARMMAVAVRKNVASNGSIVLPANLVRQYNINEVNNGVLFEKAANCVKAYFGFSNSVARENCVKPSGRGK